MFAVSVAPRRLWSKERRYLTDWRPLIQNPTSFRCFLNFMFYGEAFFIRISGADSSRYTVHLPLTPDNQLMPKDIVMQGVGTEDQYVSNLMFIGGYNRVTHAHSRKIIDSDPAIVVAEGSSCDVPGCGSKMMDNRQGVDFFACECGLRICKDCYGDAMTTRDGSCPGCREHYRELDVSEMAPASQTQLSKSDSRRLPMVESTELLMRNHTNEFDYTQYLYETNKNYGYGNVVWPTDSENGNSCEIGSDRKLFLEERWKPLTQKSSIRVALLNPEKEPPLVTVNTIFSILAAEYSAEKLACYVSDDAGALLTFEAMAEAASFARLWVPFCRKRETQPKNPYSYFKLKIDQYKNKVRPYFVRDRGRVKHAYDEFKVGINGLSDSIRIRSFLYLKHSFEQPLSCRHFCSQKQLAFERMVRVSVLNDALKNMYNAENRGKRQVMIRPSSKVIIKFLMVMQKHDYIGEFEYVDDHGSGKIVVELNGRLNKCGVISYRFDVGLKEIEGWIF